MSLGSALVLSGCTLVAGAFLGPGKAALGRGPVHPSRPALGRSTVLVAAYDPDLPSDMDGDEDEEHEEILDQTTWPEEEAHEHDWDGSWRRYQRVHALERDFQRRARRSGYERLLGVSMGAAVFFLVLSAYLHQVGGIVIVVDGSIPTTYNVCTTIARTA